MSDESAVDRDGPVWTCRKPPELVRTKRLDIDVTAAWDGRPESDLFTTVVSKARFISVFEGLQDSVGLTGAERVLEVGGGTCWASAILKRSAPGIYMVASDLSQSYVSHSASFENLLNIRVDERWAFPVTAMPFADAQFDVVFAFASFHHFVIERSYQSVLHELLRVLRPGGRLLLLFEPSSPAYVYRWARRRVNRKRVDGGVEDVLRLDRLRRTTERLGVAVRIEHYPEHANRVGLVETLYYWGLSKARPLAKLLPSTVNVTIWR